MKNIIVVLLSGLTIANAQTLKLTNTSPVLPSVSVPALSINMLPVTTNEVTIANDLLSFIDPFIPSLTNKNLSLDISGLYHNGLGFEVDAEYEVSTNFAIGTGPEYIDKVWYINCASINLGTTKVVPIIGKLHVALISDLQIRAHDAQIGNQTMSYFYKEFDIYKNKLTFDLEGGYGYNSHWNGTLYRGGGKFNLNW